MSGKVLLVKIHVKALDVSIMQLSTSTSDSTEDADAFHESDMALSQRKTF